MNKAHQWKMLGKAIHLVTNAFKKDTDRGGKPYVLHCLHVMNNVDQNDPELMQIAVMHDLLEDHPEMWSVSQLLREGFSTRVCTALAILKHDPDDDYLELYIPRIMTNWDCVRVKREDLKHNGCVTRSKGIRDKDVARYIKYITAFNMLSECSQ